MSSQNLHFNADTTFDVNEVKQHCYDENDPNNTAWINLNNALCTPEFCPNERIREGKYHKLLYPVSKAETEEMERRLELAENTQENPDPRFSEILSEMKDIVAWSKTKHFSCSWKILIAYLIIFPFIPLILMSGGKSIDIEETQKKIALVETWEEKDVYFTQEETKESKVSYEDAYNSVYNYKFRVLNVINSRIEREQFHLQSVTSEVVEKAQKKIDEEMALFEVENKKTAKEIKEEVLSEFQQDVDTYNERKTMGKILNFLTILLIPLYLVSCYQYGYNITRFINFRESMDKLFMVGGSIAGAGAAMGTVVEVTRWSNGSETRQTTSPGVVFVLAGLLILLLTSGIIMLFSTINGLYYNYIKEDKTINQKIASLTANYDVDSIAENKKGNLIFRGIKRIISRNMSNIFVIDGREGGIGYLIFILFMTIVVAPILALGNIHTNIFVLFTFSAAIITSSCRRLHDVGLSSKVLLVVIFVPFLIYFLPFIPGKKDANDYGPAPKNDFD